MPKPDTYRRAFSLIELAVVIAVVMILLAALVPSLMRARASALQVSCASKLRGIGAGLQLYVGDQKNYPLSKWELGPLTTDDRTWAEALFPYMFTSPLPGAPASAGPEFSCPGSTQTRRSWNNRVPLSYQVNAGPLGDDSELNDPSLRIQRRLAGVALEDPEPANRPRAKPLPFGYVQTPSDTLFASDGRVSSNSYLESLTFQMRDATTNTFAVNPHSDMNNFLYCDGHVELQKVTDTIGAPAGNRWNPRGAWTPLAGD